MKRCLTHVCTYARYNLFPHTGGDRFSAHIDESKVPRHNRHKIRSSPLFYFKFNPSTYLNHSVLCSSCLSKKNGQPTRISVCNPLSIQISLETNADTLCAIRNSCNTTGTCKSSATTNTRCNCRQRRSKPSSPNSLTRAILQVVVVRVQLTNSLIFEAEVDTKLSTGVFHVSISHVAYMNE